MKTRSIVRWIFLFIFLLSIAMLVWGVLPPDHRMKILPVPDDMLKVPLSLVWFGFI